MSAFYNAVTTNRNEVNAMNANDREFIARKIRTGYTEKEDTALDELKRADKRVKRPAKVFAYFFGSAGAIIMGGGMSLVMTDIGERIGIYSAMAPGVAVGIFGMAMTVACYPIYKALLGARKKKYAEEIIKLSDKIMKG